LSIREIFKTLAALGHGELAWKGINDFYHPKLDDPDFSKPSLGSIATRAGIALQDFLSRTKLLNYGLALVICFKEKAPQGLLLELKRNGFKVTHAPVNPFKETTP